MNKKIVMRELASVMHLPLVQRLAHPKVRKVVKVYSVAVAMAMSGVAIAHEKAHLEAITNISALIFDAIGYTIHGMGVVPVVHYAEVLFAVISGEIEREI
jgi:hypothetical protein